MQKEITLKLTPSDANNQEAIKNTIAQNLGISVKKISGFYRNKESIDARSSKQVWINLNLKAFIDEPIIDRPIIQINFQDVKKSTKKVIIVGAGPAGLFAALQLI